MHNYGYDKKAQDWIETKQPNPSRFERKMWQVSICVVAVICVVVVRAIADGF
ncbi:TMhelix containing protein [Vibrio phage 1.284.A._10N.286.55.A5]|nr:TMhelix containing protein [Vibrio phage 1.284.A._10N.286.55.A5]